MGAHTSKEVTDRESECQFLATSLDQQGPAIAVILETLLAPLRREGDPPAEFGGFLIGLRRFQEDVIYRLVKIDEGIYAARAEITKTSDLRQQKTVVLAGTMARVRQAVGSFYVTPPYDRLGMEGETSRNPYQLLRQSERTVTTFERADIAEILGESFFSEAPDLRRQVAELKPAVEDLRVAIESYNVARRNHDTALLKKRELMKEHDKVYTYSARAFEGLCRIAGQDGLADRVRPTARTRSTSEETPENPVLVPVNESGTAQAKPPQIAVDPTPTPFEIRAAQRAAEKEAAQTRGRAVA